MAYRDVILADSPTIYLEFEGNVNDTQAYTGVTNVGVTFVAGNVGQTGSFDGTSQYLTLNSAGTYFNDKIWAMEAWVKVPSNTKSGHLMIFDRGSSNEVKMYVRGGSEATNPGKVEAYILGSSQSVILTSTARVDDGVWHHVVLNFDGTNITIYIDGVSSATSATNPGTISIGNTANVGRQAANNVEYFLGNINEFAIYPNNLTTTQITNHYNAANSAGVTYTAQAMTASATSVAPAVSTNAYLAVPVATTSATMVSAVDVISDTITPAPATASATSVDATGLGNNRVYYDAEGSIYLTATHQTIHFDISNISNAVSSAILRLPETTNNTTGDTINVAEPGSSTAEYSFTLTGAYLNTGSTVHNADIDITQWISDIVSGVRPNNGFSLWTAGGDGYQVNVAQPQLLVTLSNSLPSHSSNIQPGVVGTANAAMPGGTPAVTMVPDVTLSAQAMTANAMMTAGGGFTSPVNIAGDAMTVDATMIDSTIATTGNAVLSVADATANAFLVPPLEALSEVFDPYYNRLAAQVGTTDTTLNPLDIWLRLDETSGTTAINRIGGDGTYNGSPIFGGFGPENRRVVNFDGVDDYISIPESVDGNFPRGAVVRAEFTFRTTKSNQVLCIGTSDSYSNSAMPGTTIAGPWYTSGLDMRNGKIHVFSSGVADSVAYATRKRVDDGEWHHVVYAQDARTDQFYIYIDGKLDIRRYGSWRWAMPEYIGADPGQASSFFEGDIMETVFSTSTTITERDIVLNYYAVFGIVPVNVAPATASAEMKSAKGKGNRPRALGLYYGNHMDLSNAWDDYEWTGIARYDVPKAPFEMNDYIVFPQDITTNHSYEGWEYLQGRFYNEETGEPRYIDLTNPDDIDVSEYDMVFFLNTPPVDQGEFLLMIENIRKAQDIHGFSIWIPQPAIALAFGIINRIDVHSMRHGEQDGRNAVGAWGDPMSVNATPFNFNIPDPYDWSDSHAINKLRIVATVDGLTSLGGYILTDYVYGCLGHGRWFTPPVEAWKHEERPNGLQIGDELFYPQDFYTIAGSANSIGIPNNRYSVVSVPEENVLAGLIVAKEQDKYWNWTTLTDNPWKNNATVIVVRPGDNLGGRPVNGRIFVSFMDGFDGQNPSFEKQLVPPNEQITDQTFWETPEQREWDYSSSRVSRVSQSVSTGEQLAIADNPLFTDLLKVLRGLGSNGGLIQVIENERYPVVNLPGYNMLFRAMNWLKNREIVSEGDNVVRAAAFTADATMPDAVAVAQRDAEITVTAAIANAEIRKPAEATDGDTQILVLPMEASATITGYGRTLAVPPMTASATMVENFDMVHAAGEQVVLYLHYTDATVYLKEDA